jgi:hypothetical protein
LDLIPEVNDTSLIAIIYFSFSRVFSDLSGRDVIAPARPAFAGFRFLNHLFLHPTMISLNSLSEADGKTLAAGKGKPAAQTAGAPPDHCKNGIWGIRNR